MSNIKKIEINALIAQAKYDEHKNIDPFPEIPCALLNSADIINYVEKAAILNPFLIDEEFLKPASCTIRIEGKYIYWESNENKIEGVLEKEGDSFVLKKNTIVFVSLESRLRLPHYIAARFNLQIKQVHRGILLGTGPLVDPGFNGDLFIPLHNLTSNDYEFKYHDPLIWMEFTKISNSKDFVENIGNQRKGKFFPFKITSSSLPPAQYLAKAAPHTPIVNSFSTLITEETKLFEEMKKTEEKANKVTDRMEKLQRSINIGVFITVAGLMGTFAAMVNLIYPDVREVRKDHYEKMKEIDNKSRMDSTEIGVIKMKLSKDSFMIETLRSEINELKQKKKNEN